MTSPWGPCCLQVWTRVSPQATVHPRALLWARIGKEAAGPTHSRHSALLGDFCHPLSFAPSTQVQLLVRTHTQVSSRTTSLPPEQRGISTQSLVLSPPFIHSEPFRRANSAGWALAFPDRFPKYRAGSSPRSSALYEVPAVSARSLGGKQAVEKACPPNARVWCPFTKISQMSQPLPLKLVNQRGGVVPFRLPRRQCGQGEQSRAVVGILTAPPGGAGPKLEKQSGAARSWQAPAGVALPPEKSGARWLSFEQDS